MDFEIDSLDAHPQLSVRLRDDRNVWGTCAVAQGAALQLSSSFGAFGREALKHAQEEA